MKALCRAVAIIGAAAVFLAAFCSCSGNADEAISNSNAAKVMAPIMQGAEEYYSYINLGTLETAEYVYDEVEPAPNGMRYVEVSNQNLNTVAKLKAAAEEFYTPEYAQKALYTYGFDGEYPLYKEVDGKLCLSIDGGGGGSYAHIADTSKVVSSDKNGAVVEMDCNDNYGGLYKATVTLKLTGGKYRIDNIEYTE